MKKHYLLLLLYCSCFFGQNNFQLDTIDTDRRTLFAKDFESNNKLLITELTNQYKGKTSRLLKQNLEEFSKEFSTKIKERNFLFDQRFLSKVNEILEEFKIKNNVAIPKNMKILISKNPSLNAYCLPDGTFVVNMGLFYWLNNEDQVAGIIAHEISHKILNHSIKRQLESIEDEISKNAKEQVREIKREKYNRSEKAFELFKDKLYAKGNQRKRNEYAADSLGYLLLKNTKYNKFDYIETLKLMAKYDSIRPKGLEVKIYPKLFNLPNQSFKDEWLKVEDFSNYDYNLYKEKLNADSLSTHPETEDRIKKLEILYPELKNSKTNKASDEFKKLETLAEYNVIPNLMFFEEYGVSIYICLNQLQNNKDDIYYKNLLGRCFTKIYEARKEYKGNRYLDRIDPKNHSESYVQFLSFMWNLKLEEIKAIAEFYNK